MNFEGLEERIPYAIGKKLHVLSMTPYEGVTLRMPGRHQKDTPKKGGDFVVIVTDPQAGWKNHPFTHDDIFIDFEGKRNIDSELATGLLDDYYAVVVDGIDLNVGYASTIPAPEQGVHTSILLPALQCLAVAEHRRYGKFEPRGGGRFLPLRFTAGIVEGKWTAAEAIAQQKRGRPGVEHLESLAGIPDMTARLLDTLKAGV